MQFSLLNSSDIKMVPQYCSYGSAGMPAMPATIFMSVKLWICLHDYLNSIKDLEFGHTDFVYAWKMPAMEATSFFGFM